MQAAAFQWKLATLSAAPVCNCPVDSSGSRAQHGFRKYLPNSSYLIIKRNTGRRWRSRKGYYTTQAQRLHTRGMLRNRSVLRTPPSSLTCRLPVYNTQKHKQMARGDGENQYVDRGKAMGGVNWETGTDTHALNTQEVTNGTCPTAQELPEAL